jgi:transposase
LSIPKAARIFQVGLTFIKKMLKWHRAGESLEPRHGGGPVPLLSHFGRGKATAVKIAGLHNMVI